MQSITVSLGRFRQAALGLSLTGLFIGLTGCSASVLGELDSGDTHPTTTGDTACNLDSTVSSASEEIYRARGGHAVADPIMLGEVIRYLDGAGSVVGGLVRPAPDWRPVTATSQELDVFDIPERPSQAGSAQSEWDIEWSDHYDPDGFQRQFCGDLAIGTSPSLGTTIGISGANVGVTTGREARAPMIVRIRNVELDATSRAREASRAKKQG